MSNLEALIGLTAGTLGVLLPAFRLVEQMAYTYKGIKFAKGRCKAVIRRAGLIIKGLHDGAQKTGIDVPPSHLTELQEKLEDVQVVLQKLADMSFLKALLHSDMIDQEIETADRHLSDCLQVFQIELLFRAQADRENAANSDKVALQEVLKELKGNYTKIRRLFGINTDKEEDEALVAMERSLRQTENRHQDTVETQIIKSSLECIKSSTGKSSAKQSAWLITDYELDFGGEIGGGGFSTVRRARFRGTLIVAVKMLKDVGDLKALEKEIEIWSRLRHDHIVPFYGASTLASKPYIVSRYMRNGNLVRYLSRTPTADRTQLIYEISLGMFYLHSEKIVHGDLKGINILVDDAGKACITDFGLSSFNSPVNVGAGANKIVGTLWFLAPEALKGQPLNFGTDTYAFGMVIYEVFTEEIPFVGIPDDVIMRGNLTLTRPTSTEVISRGLNDAIWQLVLDTTSSNPAARPLFATVTKRLEPTKEELFTHTFELADTDLFEKGRETNWTYGPVTSETLNNSGDSLIQKNFPVEKRNIASGSSFVSDISSESPMRTEVVLKYFNVEFGLVRSQEPAVHIKENGSTHWQPVRAKKGSLLREEANGFTYKSSVGEGINVWRLDGNKATLHSLSVDAECCFKDTVTARKWFDLQLNYARNGTILSWGPPKLTVTGDWITKTQNWRRTTAGKLQTASFGAPNQATRSWSNIDLPKRYAIDRSVGNANSLTCIVNPESSRSSKYRCTIQGSTVAFSTYLSSFDQTPSLAREESYASEAEARAMFNATKVILEKGVDKKF